MKYIIIECPRPYGTSQVRHSFGKLKFPSSQSSCQRVIGSLLAIADERSRSSPKVMILSVLSLFIKQTALVYNRKKASITLTETTSFWPIKNIQKIIYQSQSLSFVKYFQNHSPKHTPTTTSVLKKHRKSVKRKITIRKQKITHRKEKICKKNTPIYGRINKNVFF